MNKTMQFLDDFELEDMARSALEEGLSFGVSLDVFMRFARRIASVVASHYPGTGAGQERWSSGVEAVANMLDKQAADYAIEFGSNDMGSLSFGSGSHADAKQDHYNTLRELAEDARSILTATPATPVQKAQEPVAWQARFTGHEWAPCAKEHHLLVKANPHEWKDYETRELYAHPPTTEQLSCPQCAGTGYDCPDCIVAAERPECAEQPCSTNSDRYRAELYDEVWQKARDIGYGNVTEALIALGRIKAAEQADTIPMSREDAEVIASFFETGGSIRLVDAGNRVAHKLRTLLGKESV